MQNAPTEMVVFVKPLDFGIIIRPVGNLAGLFFKSCSDLFSSIGKGSRVPERCAQTFRNGVRKRLRNRCGKGYFQNFQLGFGWRARFLRSRPKCENQICSIKHHPGVKVIEFGAKWYRFNVSYLLACFVYLGMNFKADFLKKSGHCQMFFPAGYQISRISGTKNPKQLHPR